MAKPTHRLTGKSAPRGKSPDPQTLKRAAGLVTPPANSSKPSSRSSSSTKRDPTQRKLSFGTDTIHDIQAENEAGSKVKPTNTEDIISALKQEHNTIISALKQEPNTNAPHIVCTFTFLSFLVLFSLCLN